MMMRRRPVPETAADVIGRMCVRRVCACARRTYGVRARSSSVPVVVLATLPSPGWHKVVLPRARGHFSAQSFRLARAVCTRRRSATLSVFSSLLLLLLFLSFSHISSVRLPLTLSHTQSSITISSACLTRLSRNLPFTVFYFKFFPLSPH